MAFVLLAAAAAAAPAPAPASDPTGEWLVADKVARIKIVDCDGRMWGVVSWEAKPGVDSSNPDPNLRSRPTLGMPILLGMKRSDSNRWEGDIYNSENGKTYSANISLTDPNTLKVQGCVLGFLCGGESWTRVVTTGTTGVPGPSKAPPPAKRKAPGKAQPDATDDVCSRVGGATRLPHERGLK